MTSEFIQDFEPSALKVNPSSPRTLFGYVMNGITFLFMFLAVIPLFVILAYLLYQGISSLTPAAFVELPPPPLVEGGGFGNAILGTLILVGIALLISVPLGVMAAIYLSEFSRGKLPEVVRFTSNVLAGVPSIITGVFAFGVIVLATRTFSAWAGGFALAILMLPIIIRTTDEALKLVPQEVRQASIGVGANDYQTVLQIVLPAAIPAILTGIILATSRAAGDTASLMFTALFTQFWPNWSAKLFEPMASLAVLVFNFAIVPFPNQNRLAWAAAFVLVMLVLIANILSRIATSKRQF
ncbi:phosphate ABC transporter permease PstA [Gloeocapsa sp. PCC 73106]|uniref:phosphate ABC transporter permease PstA n=1 Tax=Gloeocapsa sp. PCC 73106 TaxID=102232 RepID=UPI0002AB9B24|nr:phosphate ABC transporter permease PstA [Gloeocapsa sp. PCC 73106]ELR98033.1 phosphate ABC transporter, permease protein PstA [Gloeocapsa sp. PCC 73106]